MSTEKPRITITLDNDQHEVLHRLSRLQGSSMSRILRDFVKEVTPILSKVADSLEIAKKASEGAKANLRKAAEAAQEELRPIAELASTQFDVFADELERLVEEDQGAEKPAKVEESPRHVITGATRRRPGSTKAKKSRRTVDHGASLEVK